MVRSAKQALGHVPPVRVTTQTTAMVGGFPPQSNFPSRGHTCRPREGFLNESLKAGLMRTLQYGRTMKKTQAQMDEERLTSHPPELWIDGVKVYDHATDGKEESSKPQDVIKKILARGPRKAK